MSEFSLFFNGWGSLARTGITAVVGFIAIVILLRAGGKRSLSKMDAYDFVSIVAIGSTLGAFIISTEASIAQAVLGFAILTFLHWLMTWLALHSRRFEGMFEADPTLIVHHGRVLRKAMHDQRVTDDALLAGLRSHGLARIEDADAMVLETDGSFSVVRRSAERPDTLRNVRPKH